MQERVEWARASTIANGVNRGVNGGRYCEDDWEVNKWEKDHGVFVSVAHTDAVGGLTGMLL